MFQKKKILTEKCGDNFSDKGIVNITSSSINCSCYLPKNSVDLTNISNIFQSKIVNSTIKYDFSNSKVQQAHYSIRNRRDSNNYHPSNWAFEESNSGSEKENERIVLETLEGKDFSYKFEIYIRFRQTGPSSDNHACFTFSAIEFFGSLLERFLLNRYS